MPDNVDTMAYVGEVPWHGLGNALPASPTVEQMREAAGLVWEPELLDLSFEFRGQPNISKIRRALVRSDSGYELDAVGPDYVPIHNVEVLEFFREYAEAGELSLETAGSLDNGRYVWALAKTQESFTVGDADRVEGYVLLANPHRYGHGATAKLTMTRVVCWNTLMAALGSGREGRVQIWHTKEFNKARRDEVQKQMGIAREGLAQYREQVEQLVALKLETERAQELVLDIFNAPLPEPTQPTAWADRWEAAKKPKAVGRVLEIYHADLWGQALPTARDTAWGLLNAVTRYVDHESGKTANTRLREAWFNGGTERLKNRALKVLVDAAVEEG